MDNERSSHDEYHRRYNRDVSTRKRRARHGVRRDPHMFTVIRKDGVEFWYGIHGPNGDHRRFALPLDVAYAFFKRHTAKLERVYERRGQPLPVVPLDDIDEYVSDALEGLTDNDSACPNMKKGATNEQRNESGSSERL